MGERETCSLKFQIFPRQDADRFAPIICDGTLRIATNRLALPAEVIALVYHYRWTIEIFFRFFKQILGCRHLLSGARKGIEIQTYCAIIACMLISLWTGKKPTLRTQEMLTPPPSASQRGNSPD